MRNVRIFISSPSDVAEERAAAREIVESLPRTPFLRGRISLELVAWDDPAAPAAMFANLTPQAAVNRGLARPSECDLTIVILWSRMGTPLAEPLKKDGTPYLSGTEWEYQDAIEAGKDVMLYRRTAKVRVDLDDRAFEEKRRQQRLLEQFFSRFTAPHGALTGSYTSYETVPEFGGRLRQDLEAVFARMLDADPPRTPVAPAISSATVTPARPAVEAAIDAPWQVHAFLSIASPSADAPLLAVACVLVDDFEKVGRLVSTAIDDLLHDAQLRDLPCVERLRREGADYLADDPEVRERITDALLAIPFEAFVWFSRTADGARVSLERTLQGLLRDRLAAERGNSVAIAVDSRNEGETEGVRRAVAAALQDIRTSDKRSVGDPTVIVAPPSEPLVTVARYVAAIAVNRVHRPGTLEIRTFERLHPSKIRLVHELGTREFFDRRRPLR